jgi:hypothetical protein
MASGFAVRTRAALVTLAAALAVALPCRAARARTVASCDPVVTAAVRAVADHVPHRRVLFIGNSFTYVNDVPCLVQRMAALGTPGVVLDVTTVAAAGATLEQHWQGGPAQRLLRENPWDYVVLQDQSSRPLYGPQLVIDYAARFAELSRAAGAQPILYMTWAPAAHPEVEAQVAAVYDQAAARSGARVAPVGLAWTAARSSAPTITLHASDGVHASPRGSYLAALVLANALTGADPGAAAPLALDSHYGTPRQGPGTPDTLPEADVRTLKQAAQTALHRRPTPSP